MTNLNISETTNGSIISCEIEKPRELQISPKVKLILESFVDNKEHEVRSIKIIKLIEKNKSWNKVSEVSFSLGGFDKFVDVLDFIKKSNEENKKPFLKNSITMDLMFLMKIFLNS